jgi:D-psicose/D-tagatose/L-ribulose 3-epimerase
MRIGVNSWVWVSPLSDEDLGALIPKVAELGFDLIELPVETPHEYDYAHAAELARAHGIGIGVCAVVTAHRDLISHDASVRHNGASYLRLCVDAAAAMGSRTVAGPLYSAVGRVWQSTDEERERDLELLAGTLRELAVYAHEHGVTLCVEPLNRFETSFLNLTSQGVELIDRVGHPACALLLDTFHMNIEERSLGEAFRLAGGRIGHVHACENDRGAPGSGHVPWGEVGAALKALGYQGDVVIESFTSKVQSIARAAAVWRPLAPSQDALAADGLRFLRQLLA